MSEAVSMNFKPMSDMGFDGSSVVILTPRKNRKFVLARPYLSERIVMGPMVDGKSIGKRFVDKIVSLDVGGYGSGTQNCNSGFPPEWEEWDYAPAWMVGPAGKWDEWCRAESNRLSAS